MDIFKSIIDLQEVTKYDIRYLRKSFYLFEERDGIKKYVLDLEGYDEDEALEKVLEYIRKWNG